MCPNKENFEQMENILEPIAMNKTNTRERRKNLEKCMNNANTKMNIINIPKNQKY